MLTIAIAFWFFLASALVALWFWGELEGRSIAVMCLIASSATFVANYRLGLLPAIPVVLVVDILLLMGAVYIALVTSRYWPLWFAGFHSISVACQLAEVSVKSDLDWLYGNKAGFWAVPALGAAVIGICIDKRASVRS
jgi:hypothetical protein